MSDNEDLKRELYRMKDEIKSREYRGLIANSCYVKGYTNAIDDVLALIESIQITEETKAYMRRNSNEL